MQRFLTVFGLLAIVFNAAMGYSATLLFCEHESGDAHVVSIARHAGASHEESCHSHSSLLAGEHSDSDVCTSCTDTKIGGEDSPEALRNSQDRITVPPLLAVECDANEFLACVYPASSGLVSPQLAAPVADALSVVVAKRTVLRI